MSSTTTTTANAAPTPARPPKTIYPVGTMLLGSCYNSCQLCVVQGYNKTQSKMFIGLEPHQYCSVTECTAHWSGKQQCWRYKTDFRWYITLSDKRLKKTENRMMQFLSESPSKCFTLCELSDCLHPSKDVIQFVLHHLMKDGKVVQEKDGYTIQNHID